MAGLFKRVWNKMPECPIKLIPKTRFQKAVAGFTGLLTGLSGSALLVSGSIGGICTALYGVEYLWNRTHQFRFLTNFHDNMSGKIQSLFPTKEKKKSNDEKLDEKMAELKFGAKIQLGLHGAWTSIMLFGTVVISLGTVGAIYDLKPWIKKMVPFATKNFCQVAQVYMFGTLGIMGITALGTTAIIMGLVTREIGKETFVCYHNMKNINSSLISPKK